MCLSLISLTHNFEGFIARTLLTDNTECITMSNISTNQDSAKAILKTYHQVHDTPNNQKTQQSKLYQKTKDLENELVALKEKYTALQNELSNRDERLARLNRQLIDRTTLMVRLQEDFEHAIHQLTNRKDS